MNYKPMPPADVDHIVIHCSATRESQDIGAADIDRWHRQRGFLKIGYHYVIRRNGDVEVGRPLDEPGAHARGWNHRSIGICLAGGVMPNGRTPEDNFTVAQWDALDRTLKYLRYKFPQADIVGHRDLPGVNKACPSFDVAEWCATHGIDPRGN
jgi:N-acetylmuramoyl-L-alanine amidase